MSRVVSLLIQGNALKGMAPRPSSQGVALG